MATVKNEALVRRILESEGQSEEIRIIACYRYNSSFDGTILYAIYTDICHDELATGDNAYCRSVTPLLVNGMLTEAGALWLAKMP